MRLKDWIKAAVYAAITSYALGILLVISAPLVLAGRELPINGVELLAAVIFPVALLVWAWELRRQIARQKLTIGH